MEKITDGENCYPWLQDQELALLLWVNLPREMRDLPSMWGRHGLHVPGRIVGPQTGWTPSRAK